MRLRWRLYETGVCYPRSSCVLYILVLCVGLTQAVLVSSCCLQSPSQKLLYTTTYCEMERKCEAMETDSPPQNPDDITVKMKEDSASIPLEQNDKDEETLPINEETGLLAKTQADVSTNKPDAATNKPDVATNKPDGATNKPDAATNKPDGATNKPDAATNKPDAATNKPDAATDEADAATDEAELSTSSPKNEAKEKSEKKGKEEKPSKSKPSQKVPPMKKTDSDVMRKSDKGDNRKRHQRTSVSEEETYNFPKTLNEFGYHFNDDGELRSLDKNEPYQFRVKEDDHSYNQKCYEALGEVITEHVYSLLEKEGLERVPIPINAKAGEPQGFFFMSPGALQKENLMLLIHGSGVVRAGQWTRKLIINNNLDKGTQLPYIRFGLDHNFGVIVLNGNLNTANVERNGHITKEKIDCSRFPEAHGYYVWDNFITDCSAKNIAVVAHSYGGVVTSYLADERKNFQQKVFAVAFTDSVHSLEMIDASKKTRCFFAEHAINWVSSDKPRDTEVGSFSRKPDAKRVSAGHEKHEWTSYAAMESVFEFIEMKLAKRLEGGWSNTKSLCTNL